MGITTLVIAIDGPSGSGKSSVARGLADRLGLAFLDTGAMYRAATWWCLAQQVSLADRAAVADAVRRMPLVQGLDPAGPTVVVGGTDISEAIRETSISEQVSAVATNLAVRDELGRLQRAVIAGQAAPDSWSHGRGIVAEGRDITTVVAPDATVRILLTASEEARLARRAREVHGSADAAAVEATRDQVLRRDADDSTVVQFHRAADGVITLDSSDLDLEETIAAALRIVAEVTAGDVGE